jgi:hypothetical protein
MVALYARRMQIELSFRDLKSHRYGQAFEDSLTRKRKRIEVLLLLHTMAAFASWLVGMACETAGIDQWLAPFRSKRRCTQPCDSAVKRWCDDGQMPGSKNSWSRYESHLRHCSIRWLWQHENVGKPQPPSWFPFLRPAKSRRKRGRWHLTSSVPFRFPFCLTSFAPFSRRSFRHRSSNRPFER